jgi:hypothetical protein
LIDNEGGMKDLDKFRQHSNFGCSDRETAIEQCDMILSHLRTHHGSDLCLDFLRVHALSLLQLIGDLDRTQRAEAEATLKKDSAERLFAGEY